MHTKNTKLWRRIRDRREARGEAHGGDTENRDFVREVHPAGEKRVGGRNIKLKAKPERRVLKLIATK